MAATDTTELSDPTGKQLAAELYSNNSSLQQNHSDHLLNMSQVPTDGLVLDLGCGTGYLATILSHLVGPKGKVIAIDPDSERIAIAKEKNWRPNIEYIVADDKSIPGEGFDLIVSVHVVHWIKDKGMLFKNLFKKLAVNGLLGFVTYDGPHKFPQVFSKAMHDLISPDFEANTFKIMTYETADTYQTLAHTAGFRIHLVESIPWDIWFRDTDHYLSYWAGVMQGDFSLDTVNKEKLQQFKAEHDPELKATPISADILFMVLKKCDQHE